MATKLLLVDDSFMARRHSRARLPTDVEFEIREAASAEEALAAFRDDRPDVVLLDLTMPGLDGMKVLSAMRTLEPDAVVIVCTADTQPETKRRCLAAGAKAVLNKPLEAKALDETIRPFL